MILLGTDHLYFDGPRFQAVPQPGDAKFAGSPRFNPFGRLQLVRMRDIAESN